MRNLTVGVFEILNITSPMNVDKRLACIQRILREDALKNTERLWWHAASRRRIWQVISGRLAPWQRYQWNKFWIGWRWISRGMVDMIKWLGISMSTSRGSYGSSWGSACGRNIRVSTRTTWIIFAMTLWNPSRSKFSATPSVYVICMTYQSTCLQLQWRERIQ